MTAPVLPTSIASSIEGRALASAAAAPTSPFTGTQQVQDWGGEWWEYSINIRVQQDAEGRALSAFFAKLRGIVNPFLFDDPSLRQTADYGTPIVNGAGQSGNTLITDGWSATGLKTGDFFSLGSDVATRLYQLTADVVPSGGAATLEFVPALRFSPSDNEALEVSNPQVLLRATSPLPTNIQAGDLYRFSISAREAI